jgi:3-oxoacyl-[acyl-carrier protein] reductase
MGSVSNQTKTIFITGAAKGLGKLLCEELHQKGYNLVGTDIFPGEELEANTKRLFRAYYAFDLSDPGRIAPFVEQIIRDHPDIGIVINNAGILDFKFLEEYTEEEILEKIKVNLVAPIYMIKSFLPFFKSCGQGTFINISSSSSMRGFETGTVYTATKAGINLLTESMNKELRIMQRRTGSRIHIHAVCPSRVATPEHLADNPGIDPSTLLDPKKVTKKIVKLIHSSEGGKIIPIMPLSLRWSILRKEVAKILGN